MANQVVERTYIYSRLVSSSLNTCRSCDVEESDRVSTCRKCFRARNIMFRLHDLISGVKEMFELSDEYFNRIMERVADIKRGRGEEIKESNDSKIGVIKYVNLTE